MANPSGWHTFAAEWRPGAVTFFYDGVNVGSITQGITASPMYLILNLGISSEHGGDTVLPSEVLVDYVRVSAL
jgi:beta-glucanase (GH16 family)